MFACGFPFSSCLSALITHLSALLGLTFILNAALLNTLRRKLNPNKTSAIDREGVNEGEMV